MSNSCPQSSCVCDSQIIGASSNDKILIQGKALFVNLPGAAPPPGLRIDRCITEGKSNVAVGLQVAPMIMTPFLKRDATRSVATLHLWI